MGKRGGGPALSLGQPDRNLVPRVSQYALNNDVDNTDALIDYLRRNYKEYQRRQIGALRQMVARAVGVVKQRGLSKPEIILEDGPAADGKDGSSSGSGSDSDSDSDSGRHGDSDSDQKQAAAHNSDKRATSVNASLLNMYAAAPPGATTSAGGGGGNDGSSGSGSGSDGDTSDGGDDDTSDDAIDRKPAFAPIEVVAAAAKRALAAERAAKEAAAQGQQQQQQPKQQQQTVSKSGGGKGDGSASPAPAAEAEPAAAAAGDARGKKSRGADAAGLQQRDREPAKKPRRAGPSGGRRPGAGFAAGGSLAAAPRPVRYADLGGIEEVLADIRETIEYPLRHPEVYAWLGVEPPRGVLLHGPPGCGKTALAHAIANEVGVPFLRIAAPEVVSGMSGESEAKLRALFLEASELAPCIVFIDEVDAIAPKRESATREMERRIVAQLLACLDDLSAGAGGASGASGAGGAGGAGGGAEGGRGGGAEGGEGGGEGGGGQPRARAHVVVIGATNRPDALDPALRRAGRFDREISLGIPTEAARAQILHVLTRPLRLQGGLDLASVARRTPGFVGADLAALAKEAAAAAVTRIFRTLEARRNAEGGGGGGGAGAAAAAAAGQQQQQQQGGAAAAPAPRLGAGPLSSAELAGLAITMADFEAALPKVQPSVRREGFTTKPGVSWDDVGSLEDVREELSFAITQPIAAPARFAAMGLAAPAGVLLYGPPGCGKTLVAKAVANESGANFISIKGPELLNKYVGESERAVRALFSRARAAHPCVLFFDELDALAPRRGADANQAAERVVNQLLTEMDGVDGRAGVYIVAATNRPDMIDPALLRPGRLDKSIFVPLPPPAGRASILRAAARRAPLAAGAAAAAEALAASARCEGFSGADVAALVREACVLALKEAMAAGGLGADSGAGGGAAAGVPQQQQQQQQLGSGEAGDGAPPPPPPAFVELRHFEAALTRVQPSVSRRDQRSYEALRNKLRAARGHITDGGAAAAAGAGGGGDNSGAPAASGHNGGGGDEPMDTAGGGAGAGGGGEDPAAMMNE